MSNDKQMTTGKRAPHLQRVASAWAMRVRGASWEEIAAALGYANAANAHRAVKRYTGTLPQPEMGELRDMWRERLEHLWPIAVRDVKDGRPGAMRAAVAVADRASKLDGLDAPSRVSMEVDGDRLDALVGELLRRSGHEDVVDAEVLEIEAIED